MQDILFGNHMHNCTYTINILIKDRMHFHSVFNHRVYICTFMRFFTNQNIFILALYIASKLVSKWQPK